MFRSGLFRACRIFRILSLLDLIFSLLFFLFLPSISLEQGPDMDRDSDQAVSRLGSAKAECSNHRDLTLEDSPELWRRSKDGAGIERVFSFKSFQAAWVRASLSIRCHQTFHLIQTPHREIRLQLPTPLLLPVPVAAPHAPRPDIVRIPNISLRIAHDQHIPWP